MPSFVFVFSWHHAMNVYLPFKWLALGKSSLSSMVYFTFRFPFHILPSWDVKVEEHPIWDIVTEDLVHIWHYDTEPTEYHAFNEYINPISSPELTTQACIVTETFVASCFLILFLFCHTLKKYLSIKPVFFDRFHNNTKEHHLDGVPTTNRCWSDWPHFLLDLCRARRQLLYLSAPWGGIEPLFIKEAYIHFPPVLTQPCLLFLAPFLVSLFMFPRQMWLLWQRIVPSRRL